MWHLTYIVLTFYSALDGSLIKVMVSVQNINMLIAAKSSKEPKRGGFQTEVDI